MRLTTSQFRAPQQGGFRHHSLRVGEEQKTPERRHLYKMKVGQGLRIFYTKLGDDIIIQDVMRKAAMDRLITKKRAKRSSDKKSGGGSFVKAKSRRS